ncbi:MAG: hypothetical protein ABJA49_12290, partial [Betaproteobacteria bacterium]
TAAAPPAGNARSIQATPGAGKPAPLAGTATASQPMGSEEQLAADQWLRRIPDDPGGLLRRKFLYQYRQRGQQAGPNGG